MRILFWTAQYWPLIGGIAACLEDLAGELVAQGHACAVVTNRVLPDQPEFEVRDGVEIHRLELRSAFGSRDPRRLQSVCQQVRGLRAAWAPDVEHLYFSGPELRIQQLCNRDPVRPSVYSLPMPPEWLLENPGLRSSLLRSRGTLIAIAERTRTLVVAAEPTLAERMITIPNCIRLPERAPSSPAWDPPGILLLGRLVADKGFDIGLRAVAQLGAEGRGVRVWVVGDGPERAVLEQLAAELGLAGQVEFTGWVPVEQVSDWLERTTIMLVPSRWQEPFGLVLLQAAQAGRPVVATRVGGIPEVVADGVTGWLVPNEDPEAMAAALRELLRSPERVRQMGAAARDWVGRQFSFPAHVDRHLELYQGLMQSAPVGAGVT